MSQTLKRKNAIRNANRNYTNSVIQTVNNLLEGYDTSMKLVLKGLRATLKKRLKKNRWMKISKNILRNRKSKEKSWKLDNLVSRYMELSCQNRRNIINQRCRSRKSSTNDNNKRDKRYSSKQRIKFSVACFKCETTRTGAARIQWRPESPFWDSF